MESLITKKTNLMMTEIAFLGHLKYFETFCRDKSWLNFVAPKSPRENSEENTIRP